MSRLAEGLRSMARSGIGFHVSSQDGMVYVPPLLAKAASRAPARRRTTSIDTLARNFRADVTRDARFLEDQFFRIVEAQGILERIARRAGVDGTKVAGEKAAGERVVFEELANLESLFESFRQRTEASISDAAVNAYNASGQNVVRSLGGRVEFFLRDPVVLAKLNLRANQMSSDIAETTFEGIRDTIRRVFYDERRGIPDLTRALQAEFTDLRRWRARTIARTETLVVVEQATQDSFQRNGIEDKQWIAAIASPTPPRPSHLAAHGQTVKVSKPFRVGSANLMHPGDPAGPPEEIINCRCDQIAVVREAMAVQDLWTGAAQAA